jgi:hypothetical protein
LHGAPVRLIAWILFNAIITWISLETNPFGLSWLAIRGFSQLFAEYLKPQTKKAIFCHSVSKVLAGTPSFLLKENLVVPAPELSARVFVGTSPQEQFCALFGERAAE